MKGFFGKSKKQQDIVFGRVDAPPGENGESFERDSADNHSGGATPTQSSAQEGAGGLPEPMELGEPQSQGERWGDVLWHFSGGNEGELEVQEGARVLIVEDAGDEWYYVSLSVDGDERGYVPRAYITIVAVTEEKAAVEEEVEDSSSNDPGDNRKKIVEEILSTEEFFVSSVGHIVKTYKHRLEELASDDTSGIEKADVKKMFSNIESIETLNNGLLVQIRERIKAWDNDTKIGDIFAKTAPVLIIYTEYANMYQEGLNFFNREKKKNERFATICEECKKEAGFDLPDLLIMPVQRVPRYNLLIDDLFKNTPDDHVDKADLGAALEKMRTIAKKINDCMRQTAKVRELTAIASKTTGLSSLLEAHRRLIRDSVMTVTKKGVGKQAEIDSNKAHYATQTEKMQFILFNDLLVYVSKTKMHDPIKLGFQIPLHFVWTTGNVQPNQFDIYVPGFKLTLQFDEKKQMGECSKWVTDFTKTIDEHLARHWKEKMRAEIEASKISLTDMDINYSIPNIEVSDLKSDYPIRYGKFEFHDSAHYEGMWNKGAVDGFGVYSLHGNKYVGLFEDGLQSGLGKCCYYTGDSYMGHWSSGLPCGNGLWLSANNDRYEGEVLNNRKHGKGEVVWSTGDRFVGNFENDEPNGYGELSFGRGLNYTGEFENGMFHGKGILVSPTGKNYSGDWVKNERCGNGILKYSDGSYYAGRWLDNRFNGLGTFYNSSDGYQFVGEYNKGTREGEGTMLYRDGSYYSGFFKNDRRHGKGSFTIPDTLSYFGSWRKDMFHGVGKLTRANGVSFEGSFEMGLLSGSTVVTLPGSKEKVNFHPSHISDQHLSFECPPRASSFHNRVEFAL